jgi:transcriptional regulator with GAF, ATPase, and Fis domain
MRRFLVSWVGQTDLNASRGDPKAGIGPIGQALKARTFDEVHLLSNYSREETTPYAAWARQHTKAKLSCQTVDLDDPTDFMGIYRAADPVLRELTSSGKEVQLTLHLSPGTPAMGAMWMLLGKSRYGAELIQSSPQKGVRTASVPFDIVAEFVELIPKLTAQPDAALEARSAGTQRPAAQFGDIVYRGRTMAAVVQRARKVAARSVAVLLEGETGTGKELMARAIHGASPRASRPFVAVNCGAIPANLIESELFGHAKGAFTGASAARLGCFRAADGGTLFLDEIGELPLDAQVKLLRALQEREVVPLGETKPIGFDVRVITATNRNLTAEVQAGRFRDDLFYRLAVAVIHVPPLREREGDLGQLIDTLLAKANEAGQRDEPGFVPKRLSTAARALLMAQRWPGNVRELEHTLMRATVWADEPTISEAELRAALFQGARSTGGALPATVEPGFVLDSVLDDVSRQYIQQALTRTGQNKRQATKLLGLNSHQVLTARMKKLGLAPDT